MTTGVAAPRPWLPPRTAGITLAIAALALIVLELVIGPEQRFRFGGAELWRGLLCTVGAGAPLPGHEQVVFELRLWRALSAAGVGALLALAGALLQGLFRNGLASPSLIGVTAGANLGATLALLAIGGYGSTLAFSGTWNAAPWIITAAAFAGSMSVSVVVVALATRGGTMSIATLLLIGVAINTCIAGALSAVQDLLVGVDDWGTLRAIQAWTFGTLDDRKPYHVALVAFGALASAATVPFVATELDLLASGEEDARALGVSTNLTKLLVLFAAAIATGCAVATAGQIGFVGLVVPHVVRLATGASHRTLLPLALLGGAVFLLGTDVGQLLVLGERRLRPGVLMSLIGGPFFLGLLLTRGRRSMPW